MSTPTPWFVRTKTGFSGPFTSAQLKAFAKNGKLPRDAHVAKQSNGPWSPAHQVKGLFPEPTQLEDLKAADYVPSAVKNSASAIGSAVSGLSKGLIAKAKEVQSQLTTQKSESTSLLARVEAASNSLTFFCQDGQDPNLIAKMHDRVNQLLVTGEQMNYMAIQSKPIANLSPDSIALTNRRFIIFRTKLLGRMEFFDCPWKNCGDVHLKENIIGSEISFKTKDGRTETLDYIPKAQARQLYRIAQEREEEAFQTRRDMHLEELQAGADRTVINQAIGAMPAQPTPSPAEDPLAKMSKLKALLDNGLISQEEFDAKRKQILDSI